jgi:hypothetical protein
MESTRANVSGFVLQSKNNEIIDFFETNSFIDPERFLLQAIQKYSSRGGGEGKTGDESARPQVVYSTDLVREYQHFLEAKESLHNDFVSSFKELRKGLSKLECPLWESRLEKDFDVSCRENQVTFTCMNCQGEFRSKKGRAVHQRKCLGVAVDHPNDGLEHEIEC